MLLTSPLKVAFSSFGCKVNQAEIDNMIQRLPQYGASFAKDVSESDVIIVNTCAVTANAQRDGEKYLAKLKARYPALKIVATGCIAELLKDKLYSIGVDIVVINADKDALLERLFADNTHHHRPKSIEETLHTRGFVKIQDGCNAFCTYCIIPHLRGKPQSKSSEDVINEIKQLVSNGYKEIILTGIHISLYGIDLDDGMTLEKLLLQILQIEGDFRIRLTSLYVNEVSPTLIDIIKNSNKKLCEHFHISLQSGSDSVLKAMGRRYTGGDFYNVVKMIRDELPSAFIGVDIIAGFPGEDEERFNETVALLEALPASMQLDGMHIFPYSERPGTKAATMEHRVPQGIRHARAKALSKIADAQAEVRRNMMIGKTVRVLSERGGRGHADNFYMVSLPTDTPANTFIYGVVEKISESGVLTL